MLNKAAPIIGPQPHLDPDIVAALDDEFDFDNPENALEDDFMEQALAEGSSNDDDDEDEADYEYNDDEKYDDFDENISYTGKLDKEDVNNGKNHFDNVETRSRFTQYSISSSVMRRNEQLTLLDDRFEKFIQNYDESEIGALECEDLDGGDFNYTNDMLVQLAMKSKHDKYETYDKNWDKERIRKLQEEGSSDEELVDIPVEDDEKPKLDCVSVLSLASGRSYKPRLIENTRKNKKIEADCRGIPKDVLDSDRGLTVEKVNKLNTKNLKEDSSDMTGYAESVRSTLSILSLRPKDETKLEKKERKKLLKEYRAERRIERKANMQAFKEEKLRQQRINSNAVTKTLT
uniref:Protein LTV1 homolog n=1 Tax=Lutzomyia longipalpis TaxID=7200 RepID=A0A1B0CG67_LUTLO